VKVISAAIVTHAGITAFVATGFIRHSDTQLFYAFASGGVAIFGLLAWAGLLKRDV
jgi:hypothetical protein